jgi:hypothetical protein
MNGYAFLKGALLGAALISSACGGAVVVDGAGGGGAASTGAGGEVCGGGAPTCLAFCGSDAWFDAECTADGWKCTNGMVDLEECPPGTCFGPPPKCSVCNGGAFMCAPQTCIDECPDIMCYGCPPGGEPLETDTCACACDASTNTYGCAPKPQPDCCVEDIQCGDVVYVPCVNGVCKPQVDGGGCWVDAQCTPGMFCDGAQVCPCGEDCDVEDKPGKCLSK